MTQYYGLDYFESKPDILFLPADPAFDIMYFKRCLSTKYKHSNQNGFNQSIGQISSNLVHFTNIIKMWLFNC
jgi:hypothetical protein